jgi:hypothetical protein
VKYTYETDCLKVSGYPLDLTISYRRAKSFLIFLVIAFFALKPIFIALRSDDPYLRIVATLIVIVSLYAGLALALDRTTISAVGKRLILRHGPLPLLRGVAMDSRDVKVFHCEETRFRAAHYYKLEVEMVDGRRVKLLSPVQKAEDAQYVFGALRRWLEAVGGLNQ